MTPDFALERATGHPVSRIAGVDEVGRGPLAGPVVTCAVILDPDRLTPDLLAALDDSKRLRAPERDRLVGLLRAASGVVWALGAASADEIGRLNILGATFLAMRRAVRRLPVVPAHVLVDGNRVPPDLPCPASAVVGGDGQVAAIAAASILAKVTRDRLMVGLDRRWPGYGWAGNAGYPTAVHRAALARLGPTRHHRRGFRPVDDLFLG